MNYTKLDIVPFGCRLLQTGDLDPVYLGLNGAEFSDSQKLRWLVAYIAFYHTGVASFISEQRGPEFWYIMMDAANNSNPCPTGQRWPRGKERRHFRSMNAVKAISEWKFNYPKPEDMFRRIVSAGSDFHKMRFLASQNMSIGSWMSFKIVDLVDACLGVEVDQSDATAFLYATPRQSLLDEWTSRHSGQVPSNETQALSESIAHLKRGFRGLTIPHKPGKPIDMFCIETIACKHLSHRHGHYPLANDLHEIHEGMKPWLKVCESARQFVKALPPVPAAIKFRSASLGLTLG